MLLVLLVFTAEAFSGKRLALQLSRRIRNHALILLVAVWIIYWGVRLAAECVG